MTYQSKFLPGDKVLFRVGGPRSMDNWSEGTIIQSCGGILKIRTAGGKVVTRPAERCKQVKGTG